MFGPQFARLLLGIMIKLAHVINYCFYTQFIYLHDQDFTNHLLNNLFHSIVRRDM